jgi:hypothetical protein
MWWSVHAFDGSFQGAGISTPLFSIGRSMLAPQVRKGEDRKAKIEGLGKNTDRLLTFL